MSLAHKLYRLGSLVTKEEIKEIIEVKDFKELSSYQTIRIDYSNGVVSLSKEAVDFNHTMFTKKIGGTSNSYYLYPNFEYQDEKDLLKKFKSAVHTFENSVMVYANEKHRKEVQPMMEYLKNYDADVLGLSDYEKGNYFLVFTLNGKSYYEVMPEIWENYYASFVEPHITKKVKGKPTPQLTEQTDVITQEKGRCGYNPNIKFFTMDNYHDSSKPQIINKLPMTKETATAIKKGWMYAISNLKFYHKGLEYIIIPSMMMHNDTVYKKIMQYLKRSKNIDHIASREDSFMRRLSKQIEAFDNAVTLDILFTEVNLTNLSVKIFATLEDVIPSRIRQVVSEMKTFHVNDAIKREENSKDTYLRDYFSRDELFAIATKNTAGMKNKIIQEKIYLAKLMLGYERLDYCVLLKKFEHQREYDYEHKKKLDDVGVKEWMNYPNSYVQSETRVVDFFDAINAIKQRR